MLGRWRISGRIVVCSPSLTCRSWLQPITRLTAREPECVFPWVCGAGRRDLCLLSTRALHGASGERASRTLSRGAEARTTVAQCQEWVRAQAAAAPKEALQQLVRVPSTGFLRSAFRQCPSSSFWRLSAPEGWSRPWPLCRGRASREVLSLSESGFLEVSGDCDTGSASRSASGCKRESVRLTNPSQEELLLSQPPEPHVAPVPQADVLHLFT